jgi:hypothetical protein
MKVLLLAAAVLLAGCSSAPTVTVVTPVLRDIASDNLDVFDIENLKIYTSQGYLINQSFRELIPLTYIARYLDLPAAKTCSDLLEAEKRKPGSVPYLNKILVYPFEKMSPKDAKLYILVNDALLRLPRYEGTFYRGTASCSFARDERGHFKPGFIERAFMPASESKTAAETFTQGKHTMLQEGKQLGCLMTIDSSNGRKIFEYTGNYNDEREILFPLNSAFRLLGSQLAGQRVSADFKELDPIAEKAAIDQLKAETYEASLKTAQSSKKKLSELAEYACQEAYKFYTEDPKVRAKINKESPVYDLKNKKLNPDDYAAPE